MIMEGFEIENWTCIRRLVVSSLPPKGVIVLHGPNRTGKSSLVQALRACLMDYPSTSTALKSCYPRGRGDKPMVTVTFWTGGTTYRIRKCFGRSKSELARRTSSGAWKVEATSAAEAHRRVCHYVGGDDSSKGLRQLLWLTQAEFRLPDARTFDPGVQAQLRGILGVLQTSLDDRFIQWIKKRWNVWYSGERKAGKEPKMKDGCELSENLNKLAEAKEALGKSEVKFSEVEGLLRQTSELEIQKCDWVRQLEEQKHPLRSCQEERERSQGRIAARKLAEERHSRAEREQQAALDENRRRADAAKRLIEVENHVGPAKKKVEALEQTVESRLAKRAQLKADLSERRDRRQALQDRTNGVAAKLRALDDTDKLNVAQEDLQRAQEIANGVAAIRRYLAENPVPDEETFEVMKRNR